MRTFCWAWMLLGFQSVGGRLYNFRYRDILASKFQEEHPTQHTTEQQTRLDNNNGDDDDDDVKELYFNQKLDHFDPNDSTTFHQRYFVTERYIVESPISEVTFLCVGGEGPGLGKSVLVDSVHCTGDMLELAHRLSDHYHVSVKCIALEHRYYGTSYPNFQNEESPVTIKNLKYLSSRQALEDLAHFVHSMNEQQAEVTKWVTFGGSYPGFMAAHARIKYPHLIFAGVSSSAPMKLLVDFPGYYRRVGKDLRYKKVGGSDTCYNVVKQGHEQAVALLKSNPMELGKMFNLCQPESLLQNHRNQELLLGDGLINIPAQSNNPSCKHDLCNIQHLCLYMTNAQQNTNSSELGILADIATKQRQSNACVQVDWNMTLSELSKPSVTDEGWRSWLWQTCTEMGFYQTCDETCPYASFYHNVELDLEICRVAFNVTNVYENIESSIDYYGGLDVATASRVLFVNGDVDPWSELGLVDSPKSTLPTAIVRGASHHAWTHVIQETDAPEITSAREYIFSVVMDWLDIEAMNDYQNQKVAALLLRGNISTKEARF